MVSKIYHQQIESRNEKIPNLGEILFLEPNLFVSGFRTKSGTNSNVLKVMKSCAMLIIR